MTAPSPRAVRSSSVLAGAAVLLALWFGTTAPSVSPVSAVPPAAVTVQVADLPAAPLPAAAPLRDGRRGRR